VNLSYIPRLVCLVFGTFFVAHTLLGASVAAFSATAIRRTSSLPPRLAARLLFAFRLLPPAFAFFLVCALCVPSYLWLEPDAVPEHTGAACAILAVLGVLTCLLALRRAAVGIALSLRCNRIFRRAAEHTLLSEPQLPALIINGEGPVLALSGVLRPEVVISRGVLSTLSEDQLQAALRHESAHRVSQDNLRRLLLLLAPGALPFLHGFAALERHWAKLAEWAADDDATQGDSRRALTLASALVRLARMGTAPRLTFLHSSLLKDDQDLAARVDRLLHPAPAAPPARNHLKNLLVPTALFLAAILVTAPLWPASLSSVHRLLEAFLH
jgi:Zn-dependent protease with chaperone function